MLKIKYLLFLILFVLCFFLSSQEDTITRGEITVKGVSLEISPAQQTVPVNTETAVNTVFAVDNPGMLKGMVVKGKLRGPGINGSISLTTLPNHPFAIPGFTIKGTYTLEEVHLERNGVFLCAAEPDTAVLEVMNVIVTEVKSRPLTLEEIREKGIVISDENFSVYNFSVGFVVESKEVKYEFPVMYRGNDVYIPQTGSAAAAAPSIVIGDWATPKKPIPFQVEFPGFNFNEAREAGGQVGAGPPVSGIVIINNDIAFLNQFFSIMFIISNNAPEGSPLTLKDLTASITFPEGLREAETNPPHFAGTPIPVHCPGPDGKIGTADDLDIILATFSGMAEFLAEGLKEGTHIVDIDFEGTLSGLPSGDTPVQGTASGAVIVKSPEFSITFAHPSIIRKGEEYDIYVTMTNTSPVAANLASLTMPATRLIGTALLSDETVSFETISPGESATAKFHMVSKETGKVRASAFAAEGNVTGKFVLTAAVGEHGIPLSPDTLVLPEWAYLLPDDLVNASLMLLGEAYCIATTPAGGLPDDLPYISSSTVEKRAREFAEAGQRLDYGESLVKTVEQLTLDWLGNAFKDINFDILRRLTTKGIKFAQEQEKIFNEELKTTSAADFQMSFAGTCAYKNPFFSAILSFAGGARCANINITDYYQNRLSNTGDELTRDIPYGELYLMEDGTLTPVDFALVGNFDEKGYSVEISGETEGTFDLALIVPDVNQGFRQVVFTGIACAPGSVSTVTINTTDESFTLSTDLDGDGTADAQAEGDVMPVQEPALQLVSATQDCTADPAGHAAALYFNRPVDPDTAKNKDNYYVEGNDIYAAFPQPSGRIVLIGTTNPISPFVESRIRVENLKDTKGGFLTPSPVEMPIEATIKTPGGIVYGQVFTADGVPVPEVRIFLEERNGSSINRCLTRTDSSGNYQFDFVRILRESFTLTVQDPDTGRIEEVKSRVMSNGQRLRIDIHLRGMGSIKGRVLKTDGSPAPGAVVTAKAENEDYWSFTYFNAQTDENGEFSILNVPIGRIQFNARLENMYGAASTAVTAPDQIAEVEITVVEAAVASVSGRVLESDGVTPVAGTYVNYFGPKNFGTHTQTDESGYFQFLEVPVGDFGIVAYNLLTGRDGGSVSGFLTEGQELNVTIIFRGSGSITGKVMNHNGTPLPGIPVFIQQTGFYTDSDNNGEFAFQDVPVGKYTVSAYDKTIHKFTTTSVSLITAGQEAYAALVFPPPTGPGGITGTVYNADKVTPAANMTVYIFDGNYTAVATADTDSSGIFQVDDLYPGNYTIAAGGGNLVGISSTAVKFAGHLAQCDVFLRGKGKVNINVFEPKTQTGIMADVKFTRSIVRMIPGSLISFGRIEENYRTDENGHIEIDDVLMGNISVFAKNEFYPRGAVYNGELTYPGQELTIDLVMKPSGTVKVKVVDYDGVTIVPGAALEFTAGSLPVQTDIYTDENGEFEFTLVPPGYFSVRAENTETNLKGRVSGSMGEGGETVEVTVRLLGRGQVSGAVKAVNNESEELIPDVKVTLKNIGFPNETMETTSDSDGRFTFYNVCEGPFSLSVPKSDQWSGGTARGEVPGHNAQVELDIYVTMVPHGVISGRVLSSDSSDEMTNCEVVLTHSRYSGQTIGYFYITEPGGFRFENIPEGSFKLEVIHPASGRKGQASGTLTSEGENVVIDIPLEGRGTVTGTFFDGSKVNPITEAPVKIRSKGLYPFTLVSSTDSQGNFRFQQVGVGQFDLEATDDAAALMGTASGEVEYDEQTVYINIYAQGTGIVTGTVYEPNGTTPSPGAWIRITSGNKTYPANADTSGNYRVEGIPVGNFSVRADEQIEPQRDYGTASGKLEFHGQELVVNVTFQGLGTVTGRVLDGNGNPVPDIAVDLRSNYEKWTHKSGDSGEFLFENIRMGVFSIEASDHYGLSDTGNGELISDGQVVNIDLTLESAGSVSGNILNPDGTTPAESAYITLKGSNFTKYGSADSSGHFLFNAVKLGDFTVDIQGINNSGKARVFGQLAAHDDTVNFNDIRLDNVSPEITEVFPANGTGTVPLNSNMTVHFSEEMDASSINTSTVKLTSNWGNTAGSVVLSQDLKSAVFTPAALLKSFTLYSFIIDKAVEDAAGNQLGTAFTASFTTSDTEPPLVVSMVPANNASGIPIDAVINVTFNEPVDPSQFNAGNMMVTKEGTAVTGAIGFNEGNMSVVFTPAALQTDSTYAVLVQQAVDFAGNVQSVPFNAVFSTIDTIAPTLQLVPPAGGTSVIEGSTVQVSADTGTTSDISVVHFFINGELKYTDHTAPYKFQFIAPLLNQTSGSTFLVEAYAVDHEGNQGPRANLTFTLLSDSPPQVTLTGPSETIVYPGGTISCSVSAADDIRLTRITVTAVGGSLNYLDTQNVSQSSFSKNYLINVPAQILPGTAILLHAEAEDSRGYTVSADDIMINVPQDEQNPVVNITSPSEGVHFKHNEVINIVAQASDDVGIKEVRIYLDDQLLATHTQEPYTASYTVPPLEEEKQSLVKVEAEDLAGKVSQDTKNILLEKLIDEDAPRVKILSPSDGSLVFPGENLEIKVDATDDEGVDRVEIYIDNQLFHTDTEEPYETDYPIPAGTAPGTTITFKAVAVDVGDKSTTDQSIVEVVTGTILPDGTVIETDNTDYENQVIIINDGTVTINGAHTFTHVLVKESGILTHSNATTTEVYKMELTITGKLVIGIDAAIDVKNRGYLGGYQDGNSSYYGRTLGNTNTGGSNNPSGGSYGGYGAIGINSTINEVYGSIYNPSDPGSGGGGSVGYHGGSGGGVIIINTNELVNDGGILCNGGNANLAGAGSGGSIYIKVNTLKGGGTITANGGNSGNCAGGGGRIALCYENAWEFDLAKITAYGGTTSSTNYPDRNGSAGTIYHKKNNEEGKLIIDNRGNHSSKYLIFPAIGPSTITEVSGNVLTDNNASFMPGSLVGMKLIPDINNKETNFMIIDNNQTTITVDGNLAPDVVGKTYCGIFVFPEHLIIKNTYIAEISGDAELGNLSVLENTMLYHPASTADTIYYLSLKVSEKINIDAASCIIANSRGYLGARQGDNNSDYGRTLGNTNTGASNKPSGGSYGGYGAIGGDSTVNEVYGSIYNPLDPGSGGGGSVGYHGGSGGGVIIIDTNELVNDGGILCNGGNASLAGAGSGGSIYIKVNTFKGGGTITANGGNSGNCAGGGGRIALYYEDASEFDLEKITAYGGTTSSTNFPDRSGSAGSIYLKKQGEPGQIIINNKNTETQKATPLTAAAPGTITALTDTVLTDEYADFVPNSLVGMALIPNINRTEAFTIISNTFTEIEVETTEIGLTNAAKVGDHYRVKHPVNLLLEDSDTHINGNVNVSSITMVNTTLTLDGILTVDGQLSLQSGSRVTHSTATIDTIYTLQIEADEIVLDQGSTIDVNACGYLGARQGDNNSDYGRTLGNTITGASNKPSGGSYAGYGAIGGDSTVNEVYGSIYNPLDPGSGGGGSLSYHGGSGGGVIIINTNELVNDGGIFSNGGNASNAGSGSGGSIYIKVNTLKGGGTITANGGNSGNCAGGGGRIALYYENASEFDLAKITAYGGTTSHYNFPDRNGSPGTIYLKKNNEEGKLIIDNRGNHSTKYLIFPAIGPSTITEVSGNVLEDTNASFMPGSLVGMKLIPDINNKETNFVIIDNNRTTITVDGNLAPDVVGKTYCGIFVFPGHLIIKNTYIAEINGDAELGNLSVLENTMLYHPASTADTIYYLSLKVTEKINIDAASCIIANSRGYLGGYQEGNISYYGRTLGNTNTGGSFKTSGGSYGGYGGIGSSNPVNEVYGSLYNPSHPGSGGGARGLSYPGKNGGGVIRIDVGELVNNGGIYANGGHGGSNASAGSGGSIFIKANTLKGGGTITANGGNSGYGAGGGGRIAVYYENASEFDFSKITAYGGTNTLNYTERAGGAGTIYLEKSTAAYGDLIIDNNNSLSRADSTTLPAVGQGFNTLLEANKLESNAAPFIPGALTGIKLNPQPAGNTVFTIISNTSTEIFTDPADGDMTQISGSGSPYIGEHYLFNLTIKGSAQVFTLDRIQVTGTLTIEPGSTLKAENHQ